jgi:hypothetical protein
MRGMPWLASSEAEARSALASLTVRAEESPAPDVWTEVGLAAVLRRVTPGGDDQRLAWCTCREPERSDPR